MHQIRGNIINATCSIRNITHYDCADFDFIDLKTECFKDVRDNACIKHESLGELQGNGNVFFGKLFCSLFNPIQCFIDLEVVMRGKDAYGMFKVWIFGIMLWDSCDKLFDFFGLLSLYMNSNILSFTHFRFLTFRFSKVVVL